jgi:hypothetical protein
MEGVGRLFVRPNRDAELDKVSAEDVRVDSQFPGQFAQRKPSLKVELLSFSRRDHQPLCHPWYILAKSGRVNEDSHLFTLA